MAKIPWTMTTETHKLYLQYSNDAIETAQDGDVMRQQEAMDKFAALPGRPLNAHPELDLVVPKIVDTGIKIYSH